ncbi:sensor histidine kinase [Clostridium ihumii]|uniref:sensor histidine kinase n=1 Tax=Clostridium ihumii TaxID=1470356 RepID=UPI003D34963E
MKDSFKKENFINKLNVILKASVIIISIFFIGLILFLTRSIKLTTIVSVFSILIILIMFAYEKIYKIYMQNTFVQLSDMLDTIINMRDENIFSTTEDTVLSKLQYQTIKLTNILKSKNKKIEDERNEIKSLISDIAHQLKTPLTNLKMYGEFLQDESLTDEERKEFSEVINTSLNRLSFLVESMIKMSRLESGVIQLKTHKNNLNDTVLMVIGQIQKKAKEKNIEIKLEEIDKIELNYDKNWISEAILNILDNAVKYTGENGEIQITLQSYDIFSRVDIKDNGMGIEENEIPKIFSRFYRGNNTLDVEGIGIGLYLSREIVDKHGGYIKVKSNENETIFSVFLPNSL